MIAGDDFDGGSQNGGFAPLTRTLVPDNTEFNGLFAVDGSRFDRFGIANATVQDNFGDESLPFGVVDQSTFGFLPDVEGIVSEFKEDNFFISVDLNNDSNAEGATDVAPNAQASWTFDVSGYGNLQLSIDMAMLGSFELDDEYNFSYSIDGSAPKSAFAVRVRGVDDGAGGMVEAGDGYTIVMDDGDTFVGDPNTFFSAIKFDTMGCTLGMPNSCMVGTLPEAPTESYAPDDLDANQDGYVYYDSSIGGLTDTPGNPAMPETGAIRIYKDNKPTEEDPERAFSTPEIRGPNENPLAIDNDPSKQLTNKLVLRDPDNVENTIPDSESTYTAALIGSGSTLTLTLDAIADGGDEFFAFDNIKIEGIEGGGGLTCDLNADGQCDSADLEVLQGSPTTAADVSDWLAAASDPANPYLGGTKTFLVGDVNLDGGIDSTDLGLLLNNFGGTGLYGAGNLNVDEAIDSTDLGLLLNNFGASSVAVPEPTALSTFWTLLFGFGGFIIRRRK